MTMVHRGWIRVYFRDRFKVFRALPGVEVLNDGDLISLDLSVYTIDESIPHSVVYYKRVNK